MAQFKYKSGTLKPYQLGIVFIGGSLLAILFIVLAFTAFNRFEGRPDHWYFFQGFEYDVIVNYVVLILAGVTGGVYYYYREYRIYHKLTFVIDDNKFMLKYPDERKNETFAAKDLRDLKTSIVFYSFFGYIKVILRFKDAHDHRRKTRFVLVRKNDSKTFAKEMKTIQDANRQKSKKS